MELSESIQVTDSELRQKIKTHFSTLIFETSFYFQIFEVFNTIDQNQ
jgi:hypothetical protein